jgi:glycosyltransferase involved in cell wall biosynthesis
MHGGYFQDTFYSASQRTKKQIYDYLANANAIIAISHQMRNFLGKSFDIRDKVTVVPNACETLSEAPIDLAGHSEPVCIVYSGRYNKPKGVFDLLAAFEKAEFKVPVKLDLFGNGEVKKVKAQVTQSSNKDLISVSGWKEHKQYILELKNYDLLVLPSYAETFGLSLVEAMGLGVPVISTTAPAIPEVVKDGETGLLVEAGNIDALAEAIAKVANKKDLRIRLGKNAWADVKERFSPSVVLDKLEHLYSHLQKDSQSI